MLSCAIEIAEACGFDRSGRLNMAALEFRPEVRQMCAADRCGGYGKNWGCPPNCPSTEEMNRAVKAYSRGLLVQTVGQLEDDFDYEAMVEAEARHSRSFIHMAACLREQGLEFLPMGAGICRICPKCTCPDAPCRFPQLAYSSMEAYGLWVSDVCEKSGLAYYSGPLTVTYTSCFLFK